VMKTDVYSSMNGYCYSERYDGKSTWLVNSNEE